MTKKIFSKKQLRELSAEEIIEKIQNDGYSLLKTLGAENLRKEMVPVGKICKTGINYFINTTKNSEEARKKLVKTLCKFTPGSYDGFPHDSKKGLVVGFNHPSLGEIPRILMMKIDKMGNTTMLFPVNLPWYEALAPNYKKICELGIIITPTITPSTWKKIDLKQGTELYEAALKVKRDFRDLYTKLSCDVVKSGGVIFVAPSATRQRTVFLNKDVYDKKVAIIPTMSVLASELYKDKKMDADFLPMAVLPPKGFKKGLNFGKKYTLIPGKVITADEFRKKYLSRMNDNRIPDFDYDFHQRIADELPKDFWY